MQVALDKHPSLLNGTLSQFVHKDKGQTEMLKCWEMCKKRVKGEDF